jgi:hypothetical protein
LSLTLEIGLGLDLGFRSSNLWLGSRLGCRRRRRRRKRVREFDLSPVLLLQREGGSRDRLGTTIDQVETSGTGLWTSLIVRGK